MNANIATSAALFSLAVVFSGCASTSATAPFPRDRDYPADWPAIAAIGPSCTELDGIYANEGSQTTQDRTLKPITLASLVPWNLASPAKPEPNPAAQATSLKVIWQKENFILRGAVEVPRLRVTVDDDRGQRTVLVTCSREKRGNFHDLKLGLGGSGGAIGPVFVGGATDVVLMEAVDGSLIARCFTLNLGLVAIVPYSSTSHCYARFLRTDRQR